MLERRVEETLSRIELAMPLVPEEVAQAHEWATECVRYLDRRRDSGAPDACPLPELFSALLRRYADLEIRAFHEGLRRMNRIGLLELLPAENPGELPQPEFALLDGCSLCYSVKR